MGKSGDFLAIGAITIMVVGIYVLFKDKLFGGQASCYGANGNCTYDICDPNNQSFCWEGLSSSANLFKTCTKSKPGTVLTATQGCAGARAEFCRLHSADGKCTSNKCPSGQGLNYQGKCVPL